MSKQAKVYRQYLSQLETPKARREHSGFNLEAPRQASRFVSPVHPVTAARWSLLLIVSFFACCCSLRADPATVASVSSTEADGAYGSGVLIPITVTFSAAVNVTGTPTLALNSGGTASYASGSGTTALAFNYTVGVGDNSAALDYTSAGALALAGGTINDVADNAAVLTLPDVGGPGSIEATSSLAVDTTAPTVTISAPSALKTVNGPVTYTVSYADANFSQATLTAGDISLNQLGSATGTISVTGGTGSATGTNYMVTISNITGSCTLGISVAAGTAADLAGNSAPPAGPSFPAGVDAWQFVSLYSFTNGVDGNMPQGGLTLASDGNYYGVTLEGGAGNSGTIFSVNTNGLVSILYSFTGLDDGGTPHAGLVQAGDGFLYGTTIAGGTNNNGTVFRISTNGDYQVIYTFSSSGLTDGSVPNASLIQGSDGNLYGTTSQGGANSLGTVFCISTGGVLTNLYSFTGGPDGDAPMAPLFQASDGNLYGTASLGGTNNQGTVFQITTNGLLTPLYSFSAAPNLTNDDGTVPLGGLVQALDGALYGVTSSGGPGNAGTLFQITTNGSFTVVHALAGATEGYAPSASLILGRDGNLYGTTQFGGPAGNGTVFQATTGGVLTTLYSFVGGSFGDGAGVVAPLVQGPDGNLYGAATESGTGGPSGAGAIFELINPNPPPIITSALAASATCGIDFSYAITASGNPASFDASGLPAGLSVDNGSGIISGSPATNGTFNVTISATNSGGSGTATLSLTVGKGVAIVLLDSLNQTYDGSAKNATVTTVPAGLNVDLTYDGSPDAPTDAGSYTVIGTVNDANYDGSATDTLVVGNATLIVTADNQSRYIGQADPVFTATMIGVVASDGLSVLFSTTATQASPAGGYDIVPSIDDPNSRLGNYDVTLVTGQLSVVGEAPLFSNDNNATFTVGVPGSFTVAMSSVYPVIFNLEVTNPLPAGLSLTDNGDGTATLGGTPAPGAGGVYPLDITAINSSFPDATQGFALTVNEPVTITSAANATFHYGTPGAFTVTTGHCFPTNVALLVSGYLPAGVTFADNGDGTGTFFGTPVPHLGVNFTFDLVAANNQPPADTQHFTLALTRPAHQPPVAGPVTINARQDVGCSVPVSQIMANAYDTDGEKVTLSAVGATSSQGNGKTVWTNGLVMYFPKFSYYGPDSFTYTVKDSAGVSTTGTVSVNVIKFVNTQYYNIPAVLAVAPATNGCLVVCSGLHTAPHKIQYRNTVDGTSQWQDLTGNIPAQNLGTLTAAPIIYTDTTTPAPQQRFYRVVQTGPIPSPNTGDLGN